MVKSDWWSNLTINNESRSKVLQYSLAATWTCGHCGSHFIIIRNFPHHHTSRKSEYCLLFSGEVFSSGLPLALVWLSSLAA